VSDVIYQKILGVRGAFATASPTWRSPAARRRSTSSLIVADPTREQHMVSSRAFPHVALVVAGRTMARVCLIRDQALRGVCATGAQRRTRQVRARPASTAPPSVTGRAQAGAHPGRSSGNPDIYILDLASQDLTRITRRSGNRHRAGVGAGRPLPVLHLRPRRVGADLPDRRAAWSAPEAHHLRRQLQRRPRVSPDGSQLAMVTLDNGAYRVAVQDLGSGTVRVLSHGRLDESPSFAPNGLHLSMRNATASAGRWRRCRPTASRACA